jgi:hypothetical protein
MTSVKKEKKPAVEEKKYFKYQSTKMPCFSLANNSIDNIFSNFIVQKPNPAELSVSFAAPPLLAKPEPDISKDDRDSSDNNSEEEEDEDEKSEDDEECAFSSLSQFLTD